MLRHELLASHGKMSSVLNVCQIMGLKFGGFIELNYKL